MINRKQVAEANAILNGLQGYRIAREAAAAIEYAYASDKSHTRMNLSSAITSMVRNARIAEIDAEIAKLKRRAAQLNFRLED